MDSRTAPTDAHERAGPALAAAAPAGALAQWLRRSARFARTAAEIGVLMLSPSSYRGATLGAITRQVYRGTAPYLLGFTLLSSLISVVLIRIVLVTAESYGLSQFALEAMVRVLVLELIPLFAALFVAVEITLPAGAEVAAMRARGNFAALRAEGIEPLAREVLPRTLAGLFALPTLAALSGLVAMVLSYLMSYGATPWAFDSFTRVIGKIFEPAVALIFALKTLGFSFAVSLIPMAAAATERPSAQSATGLALQNLVRMTLMILLIEAASLVGNYT